MIQVGRYSSFLGLLGLIAVLLMMNPGTLDGVNSSPALFTTMNAVAALSAILLFTTWGLGVFHWGSRYTGNRKPLWGAVVILGAFLGATVYWWWGVRNASAASL